MENLLFVQSKTLNALLGDFTEKNQQALNQEINTMIDGTRDYLQAHYKLNTRSDSQYWIDNRENTLLSPTLSAILNTWDSTANFDQCLSEQAENLAYLKTSWYCLLAGNHSKHRLAVAVGAIACERGYDAAIDQILHSPKQAYLPNLTIPPSRTGLP